MSKDESRTEDMVAKDKLDEDQALKDRREQEDLYFKLYSRIEVQEWLLKDSVRNKAYREAILNNKAFKNKVRCPKKELFSKRDPP